MPVKPQVNSEFEVVSFGRIIQRCPTPEIRQLVLEGGGTNCYAYIRALEKLKKEGITDHLECVAGSSGGSLTATLLAFGFTLEEMREIAIKTNFSSLMDVGPRETRAQKFKRRISPFLGKYQGQVLLDTIRDLISNKLGKVIKQLLNGLHGEEYEMTVARLTSIGLIKSFNNGKFVLANTITFDHLNYLADNFPELGFKKLYITGTNLTKKRSEVFSHEKTGAMEVAFAVRISMSIPGIFKDVKFNGCKYTDGGCLNNFAMGIFEDEKFRVGMQGMNPKTPNLSVLGIKVDTKDEMEQILWNEKKPKFISRLWSSFKKHFLAPIRNAAVNAFIGVNFSRAEKKVNEIARNNAQRVIQLYDGGHSSTDFAMTDSDRNSLDYFSDRCTSRWIRNHRGEVAYESYESLETMAKENPKALQSFYDFVIKNPAQVIFAGSKEDVETLKTKRSELIGKVEAILKVKKEPVRVTSKRSPIFSEINYIFNNILDTLEQCKVAGSRFSLFHGNLINDKAQLDALIPRLVDPEQVKMAAELNRELTRYIALFSNAPKHQSYEIDHEDGEDFDSGLVNKLRI